ncbi:MAG: efflux transporter periplasmic adaptor subunit, partial [Bauldia sp.]
GDYVFVVEEAPPAPAAAPAPAATPAPAPAPAPAADAKPPAPKLVARQAFVKTGRRNAGLVEIQSGLTPGEKVITAGQNRLTSGSPVVIDNTVDPSKLEKSAGTGG